MNGDIYLIMVKFTCGTIHFPISQMKQISTRSTKLHAVTAFPIVLISDSQNDFCVCKFLLLDTSKMHKMLFIKK